METKIARITAVKKPNHPIFGMGKQKVTYVEIDGKYLYEFSQLGNFKGVAIYNTIIWKNYNTQDPFNWDGKVIGDSDLSVQGWLEEQGFEVVWETPL